MSITVHPFYEASAGAWGYVVANPDSKTCMIVDAPLGVENRDAAGEALMNTDCADQMLDWIHAHNYVVRWIFDTHFDQARPTAAAYLKSHLLCAQTVTGAVNRDQPTQGIVYDRYVKDGDTVAVGHVSGRVIATPGFTRGCVSLQFDKVLMVGRLLDMPDVQLSGCASVRAESIRKVLKHDAQSQVYVAHDDGKNMLGKPRRCRCVAKLADYQMAPNPITAYLQSSGPQAADRHAS